MQIYESLSLKSTPRKSPKVRRTPVVVADVWPAIGSGRSGVSSAHHPLCARGGPVEDREGDGRTGGRRDFPIGYWFRVRTHFANSRRLRRAGSLQLGGSQWHRTARGSPRVAQRRGRILSSTSLRVPGHPCLPSRLRVPRGSLPGRAGPSAGRQGGREGGEGQADGWQPTVFCFLTPDMLLL